VNEKYLFLTNPNLQYNMKTLYIVRHAKSSWEFPHLSDPERPLLEKGKERTKLVTKYLKKNKINVDLIISSHATRATETATILAKAIGYPAESIRINRMLYHATSENISDQFYEVPDNIRSLMIVGHNPTLTDFANQFLDKKIDWLPTSGIVSVTFNASGWDKILEMKPVVNFVIFPKMLKE